jgi:hypothetical protein
MWFTFTPHGSKTEMSGDGNGMRQPYTYKVRAVGVPLINTGDVIVDTHSDKRYAVDFVDSTFEVRRFTCLQMLTVKEIPASSAIYKLNANLTPADSCLPELS